ncbi:MAG: FGGY-family carbohydrate kinase [Gammaproteobacteria bacterium]|nr:FGGY-family carbohydrate kinase [Gammaproteobacteria bacterium]
MAKYYLGIDVGTGSARAGIFNTAGKMLAETVQPIKTWRYAEVFVEQSSDDIWHACAIAVKGALKKAQLKASAIKGIGFDATCSLVVLGENDQPLSVSASGKSAQNIIVWMDHRAILQAKRINATQHEVLKYVGGNISPEMETPKLLWLKENLPQTWRRAKLFLDLPDFLVYRATGQATRSLCSTVCKWTYRGDVGRWDGSYFKKIGLSDLINNNYEKIGNKVWPIGEAVGSGLTKKSAEELGLLPGTPVGVSVIDADAGGIGVIGMKVNSLASDLSKRLALIAGTSSCHMAVSKKPNFIPGVWGPYYSAMIPGMWLTEGGQSATGSLLDHIIFSHTKSIELKKQAQTSSKSVYEILNANLSVLAKNTAFKAALTSELHVLPYFHGNRSPRANPNLRGMISGLRLSDSISDIALLYYATLQAIAYGTKHIIDTLNAHGYKIKTIFACGGGSNNPLFLQEHADITGCQIILPKEPEAMLLGSAILGAVAAKQYLSVPAAMQAMSKPGRIIKPNRSASLQKFHARKYRIFLEMCKDQLKYEKM